MPPKTAKRKRLSDAQPLPSRLSRDDDKHKVFTAWATERGVKVHGVQPAQLPGRGLGLVVTKRIKSGERILFVPEKAMFKPRINRAQPSPVNNASPQAQLAVSVLAACKKPESRFLVWQATWPTVDDFTQSMPMCWPEYLQKLLPASVLQPLQRQKDDYAKDWLAVEKYCNDNGWEGTDFIYYWMIVNSRSFHWKPPRGGAGSMVMCPFIDYMNHAPSGSTCTVIQDAKGYEVVAERDYEVGEEVLATYGAHSNDKLLVHYSFVCSSSPTKPASDDDIRLDHIILPHLTEDVRTQLQDVGFLGAYALLPTTNEICFKTQVAVRAMLLTCNEWEYFVTNGEDMTADQSPAVRKFLEPLLAEYRKEAVQKLEELPTLRDESEGLSRNAVAVDLLTTRWTQIRDAIDAFLDV